MAKKQTRRSISVSRTTYERLKAFCETNNISMSQLVETRVNDFLGADAPAGTSAPVTTMSSAPAMPRPIAPRPVMQSAPVSRPIEHRPLHTAPSPAPSTTTHAAAPSFAPTPVAPSPVAASSSAASSSASVPMTSAAARFAVDPPPPIIKPRQDTAAPKPAEKRAEQIFTF